MNQYGTSKTPRLSTRLQDRLYRTQYSYLPGSGETDGQASGQLTLPLKSLKPPKHRWKSLVARLLVTAPFILLLVAGIVLNGKVVSASSWGKLQVVMKVVCDLLRRQRHDFLTTIGGNSLSPVFCFDRGPAIA